MVNGLTSSSEEEEEVESQEKFEAVPPSNFTSPNISPLPVLLLFCECHCRGRIIIIKRCYDSRARRPRTTLQRSRMMIKSGSLYYHKLNEDDPLHVVAWEMLN